MCSEISYAKISMALASAITKMTESMPKIIAQHVARETRKLRRSSPMKDVSGCPAKEMRLAMKVGTDDDDSCSLSGMEDSSLPNAGFSATASLQSIQFSNYHHGEQTTN